MTKTCFEWSLKESPNLILKHVFSFIIQCVCSTFCKLFFKLIISIPIVHNNSMCHLKSSEISKKHRSHYCTTWAVYDSFNRHINWLISSSIILQLLSYIPLVFKLSTIVEALMLRGHLFPYHTIHTVKHYRVWRFVINIYTITGYSWHCRHSNPQTQRKENLRGRSKRSTRIEWFKYKYKYSEDFSLSHFSCPFLPR